MLRKYLWIFFISMVPLIELRGAIPYAKFMNMPMLNAYIVAIIGNMIPVPFIYFFARKVLEWGSDKPVIGGFFTWCMQKGEKGGQKLQASAGTGAWTGTLAASLLDMDFKSSVIAVMGGVLLAGIIMWFASAGAFGALGAILG